jgi:hypothetical protein
MADRILRDEIWESDRFLELPHDTQRLAFIRLLSMADDFGNLEGHLPRLRRQFVNCLQVKTQGDVNAVLTSLMDADLIRPYKVDDRDYWHIPRFRSHRQYIVRKVPASPWDADVKLGKTQRIEARGISKVEENQQLAQNVVTTSLLRSSDVAQGVGVGVGVGVGEGERSSSTTYSQISSPPAAPPPPGPEEFELTQDKPGEQSKAHYRCPPCPTQELVDAYNELLPMLPRCEVVSDSRRAHIAARWRQVCVENRSTRADGIKWFRSFFAHVGRSKFLTGQTPGKSGRVWKADIDFIFNPTKFVKIYEDAYHQG